MLRSLSFFSLFKPTHYKSLHFLTSFSSPLNLHTNAKPSVSTRGSISDVLQILGPIHLVFPNSEVRLYIRLLKKCIRSNDSFKGGLVHAHVLKSGFKSDLVVCNVLLDMYVKSGSFVLCKKLFDEMPQKDSVSFCTLISGEIKEAYRTFRKVPNRDLVSWTAVMTGLVQSNQFIKSLEIFKNLKKSGIVIDEYCLSTALNACALNRDLKPGIQIHALGLKSGFQFSDFVTVSLIDMYSKCGRIGDLVKLYLNSEKLDRNSKKLGRNKVLINVVLNGFCDNFYPQNALELFMKEYKLGFVPDQFTYSIVLTACADLKARGIGDQIQSRVLKSGFGNSDLIVGNSFINFLIKCGCVLSTRKIFDEMKVKNENSYALLMLGYLKNRNNIEVLRLFTEMQQNGILGNYVIFNRILRGCADVAALDLGKQVHASIIKIGLIKDVYIEKALVGLYAKSDLFDKRENNDFKSIGVFMVEGQIEKEGLQNYVNAPDLLGRNYPSIDLLNFGGNNKEKGEIGEEFFKFEISDQVFFIGNLGFFKRKQNVNLGFVRS
ncbi:hypothetical protein LUZ60_000424 [Juncus effusus]|nr:hypothetical protein LUZ60_000424 [Juncus effusus]